MLHWVCVCVLEDNHTGESDVWLHSRGRWRVGLHFRWNHWSTGPFWCIVVERSIAQQDWSFPCQLHRTDLMSSDFSEVWNHYTKIQIHQSLTKCLLIMYGLVDYYQITFIKLAADLLRRSEKKTHEALCCFSFSYTFFIYIIFMVRRKN